MLDDVREHATDSSDTDVMQFVHLRNNGLSLLASACPSLAHRSEQQHFPGCPPDLCPDRMLQPKYCSPSEVDALESRNRKATHAGRRVWGVWDQFHGIWDPPMEDSQASIFCLILGESEKWGSPMRMGGGVPRRASRIYCRAFVCGPGMGRRWHTCLLHLTLSVGLCPVLGGGGATVLPPPFLLFRREIWYWAEMMDAMLGRHWVRRVPGAARNFGFDSVPVVARCKPCTPVLWLSSHATSTTNRT